MKEKIKRLPHSLRFGGTRLYHNCIDNIPPQADGVRRVNKQCVELETYANHMKSSAASYIGMPLLIYIITIAWGAAITGPDKINIGTIFRNWYASLRRQLHKPYGWLWAPITIPAWIIWLLINAYPDSVEAWLQYNVPYATFPVEIDVLCGFAEKRKPVIRVNGERIDP